MLKNKRILTLLFLLLFLRPQAQTLTLDSVRAIIAREHPALSMYEYEIRSMDEAANGARSWMAPEVSSGFWMAPYNVKRWKKDEEGMPGMGQYMIGVQQMIPSRKAQNAEYAYMRSMSSVERERQGAVRNDLFSEAQKQYVDAVAITRKLAVVAADEKLLEYMIKDAELRFRNGMDKLSAYYKAKAALGNLQSMRVMLESELEQAKFRLNTLMNRAPATPVSTDTFILLQDPRRYTIDSATLLQRSDVRALDRGIEVTKLRQQFERSSLRPTFGIRYEHMTGFGGQPAQFTLMGMMRIPFARWSARMNRAAISSLEWKTQALRQEKIMMTNEMLGMASRMRSELTAKQKQVQLLEHNILPALKKNYETMLLGYSHNTEELFMLFDAWETLYMTQLEHLEQWRQQGRLQAELEQILQINRQ
ncbi:MAG: TolC family protein [Sphingobacteriales bacterium]|nr:MAG: TolC family protein [Sphingobacteriales bacterium]